MSVTSSSSYTVQVILIRTVEWAALHDLKILEAANDLVLDPKWL